jgi:hypothetical protein
MLRDRKSEELQQEGSNRRRTNQTVNVEPRRGSPITSARPVQQESNRNYQNYQKEIGYGACSSLSLPCEEDLHWIGCQCRSRQPSLLRGKAGHPAFASGVGQQEGSRDPTTESMSEADWVWRTENHQSFEYNTFPFSPADTDFVFAQRRLDPRYSGSKKRKCRRWQDSIVSRRRNDGW